MKLPGNSRPSRLQKCPCGSGRRFKDCHGRLDEPPVPRYQGPVPPEVIAKMHALDHQHREFEARHGKVRPIISSEYAGHRFVAVGEKLHFAKNFKVFPDFLNQYLHSTLNNHWGTKQVALELEKQHPIVQWRTISALATQNDKPNERGLYESRRGSTLAWYRLAYDLYLLEHHSELQKKLLRRLRDPTAFQGARFEIAAAAAMLPAGYELEFEDDKKPGKHAEFVATHKETEHKLAVEAKSRHRPGVLGFPGDRAVPEKADITGLLKQALAKDPEHPLLVLIELNLPVRLKKNDDAPKELFDELQTAWHEVQQERWPNGFPAIGVIFYNDTAPWFLDEEGEPEDMGVFAIALWPEKHRHAFNSQELLKAVMQAIYQRLTIPQEFPERHDG